MSIMPAWSARRAGRRGAAIRSPKELAQALKVKSFRDWVKAELARA
jgi:hypothetical protein